MKYILVLPLPVPLMVVDSEILEDFQLTILHEVIIVPRNVIVSRYFFLDT